MADHRESPDTRSSIPDDLIPEIISRLPARAVLRSRAICKLWRSIIDDDRFPHAHRRHQPHMPLLRLYRDDSLASPELNPPYLRVRIEGIDLRARASQPVLRFAVAQEHKHAVESEEKRPRRDRNFRHIDPATLWHPSAFDVHGSCDGVLLISHGWSIYAYNPATRCWADLPENGSIVIGFYVHRPSGNFHILLSHRLCRAEHWVFTMGHKVVQRRIASPDFLSDQNTIRPACESPPALVSGNLHWLPQSFQSDRQLLVFDTVSETFRWMSPSDVDADGRALLELEGMLTMTVRGERTVQLWVMPNYEQPAWFCKLQFSLSVDHIDRFSGVAVVSLEGDVLVHGERCVLQCDSKGRVQKHHKLDCHRTVAMPHLFKENLVRHGCLDCPQPKAGWRGRERPPFFRDMRDGCYYRT
ncbi:uncharacterized protein LOC119315902 [Triticum dicoccoides]|uniref:uncharacterized protein LOC119315902 n=1 Tax=Triticum dicoccoides TaxID=85692 RepID=UPI001891F0A2|nr:uncharacterized protein LOC119315902 [Triticum dicoccoides]